jgi:epoxyqueuosine reductase
MEYLVRGRDRRADPTLLFSEAKSVLSVAIPYPKSPAGGTHPTEGPRYARYLQGKDYHLEITDKLQRLMLKAQSQWNTSLPEQELKWKVCVDTSAVLERSWAALAGLGWIGKNTLLIHPQYGSYLFLGEVLINQRTFQAPSPLPNYCGNCTRCLHACPTQALQKPNELNSNRCISYWTLEKKGELPISQGDKKKIGPWIAGCDICQEVCPFNIKPVKTALLNGETIDPENATSLRQWKELLEEEISFYKQRVKNSALSRVKPAQFSRNLAIALANSFENAPLNSLISCIQELLPLVQKRLDMETDEIARREWARVRENWKNAYSTHSPNRNP